MQVQKRDGTLQKVDLNKIVNRLQLLIDGYDEHGNKIGNKLDIDPIHIATKVCTQLVDGITTNQLDIFSAETCAYMVGDNLEYGILANRLIVSGHHKNTHSNFSDIMTELYNNNQLDETFYNMVKENMKTLNDIVNNNHINDYLINYFGYKTLMSSYFLKVRDTVNPNKILHMERYQHLLMRVALAINVYNLDDALEAYNYMTHGYYTHASPTLFNAGTKIQQLSSCFLLGVDDSLYGMYNSALSNGSEISKRAGGIGLYLSDIRSKGSLIKGTNNLSDGLMPFIKVINDMSSHVNQGGKRKGSIAVYLEPWHADIMYFIEAKKNTGVDDLRARDLFYGMWIPDIFMERVIKARTTKSVVLWSLMCPSICKGLTEAYGQEFNTLYEKYENEGKYMKRINILEIWNAIISSQIETGTPYMCYKDHVNKKSAQSNIGTIKCSNLCTEIMEYSSNEEYGTCNLASINLKKFVKNGVFDFELLQKISSVVCKNLNKVININYYPVKESKRSNFKHRPLGIGVQGLAETFILLGYEFTSPMAVELNKRIFETIYYGALTESNALAIEFAEKLSHLENDELDLLQQYSSLYELKNEEFALDVLKNYKTYTYAENLKLKVLKSELQDLKDKINAITSKYSLSNNHLEYLYINNDYKGAYYSFTGSHASKGTLQFDLWNVPSTIDFNSLKTSISKYGLRNSLLTTVMPTASTSHILGNTECIEPISSVIYTINTLAGSFMIVNAQLQYMLKDIWTVSLKDKILKNNGSIQNIEEIPSKIRKLFMTSYEISNKALIDMSADRGPFIDQSQSLNHYVQSPTHDILTSIHIYSWQKKLKTGSYYMRTKTIVNAKKFSVANDNTSSIKDEENIPVCRRDNPDCTSCSG